MLAQSVYTQYLPAQSVPKYKKNYKTQRQHVNRLSRFFKNDLSTHLSVHTRVL